MPEHVIIQVRGRADETDDLANLSRTLVTRYDSDAVIRRSLIGADSVCINIMYFIVLADHATFMIGDGLFNQQEAFPCALALARHGRFF